jgi:hypothetical protein
MEPLNAPLKESTFVLRRIAESLPVPALAVPILFALLVLLMTWLMYRRGQASFGQRSWIAVFLVGGPLGFLLTRGRKQALLWLGLNAIPLVVLGTMYFFVGYMFREVLSWWLVLVPVLLIALAYVIQMYLRDAHTIHYGWAILLGLMRMSVYCLLGICFLLPGCQDFDITVNESKVLVLFDVSGSMDAVEGQDSEGGVSRQDKIVRFLTTPYQQGAATKTFLEHLTDNTPVACYRFGAVADDEAALFDGKAKHSWSAEQWRQWLRPDKIDRKDIVVPSTITDEKQIETFKQSKLALYAQLRDGTDVGGSALQIVQREGNNRIPTAATRKRFANCLSGPAIPSGRSTLSPSGSAIINSRCASA